MSVPTTEVASTGPSAPRTIALVSCVSMKRPRAAAARDLYTSPWFRKASGYAEAVADGWYVLSAKYGLVDPGRVIEPYDETLNEMGSRERRAWAAGVLRQLEVVLRSGDKVIMLAGQRYREGLIGALRARGVQVSVPMEGLGIGEQLHWLAVAGNVAPRVRRAANAPRVRVVAAAPATPLRSEPPTPLGSVLKSARKLLSPVTRGSDDVDDLHALVMQMAERFGVAPLGACSSAMRWPERGVYFFLDPMEKRDDGAAPYRIVRVGTHALNPQARSTLWSRLSQHKGTASGLGNHRGSVFRKHVGVALLTRDGATHPSWGVGATAPREVVAGERELEERVSAYLTRLLVTVLPVLDEPGPTSMRGYVERNAVAVLTQAHAPGEPLPASATWLGHFSGAVAVRTGALWNVRHVGERAEASFLGRLERWVSGRSGR